MTDHSESIAIGAIDWQPGSRGVIAAGLRDGATFDSQVESSGRAAKSRVLVWSLLDSIKPQVFF